MQITFTEFQASSSSFSTKYISVQRIVHALLFPDVMLIKVFMIRQRNQSREEAAINVMRHRPTVSPSVRLTNWGFRRRIDAAFAAAAAAGSRITHDRRCAATHQFVLRRW